MNSGLLLGCRIESDLFIFCLLVFFSCNKPALFNSREKRSYFSFFFFKFWNILNKYKNSKTRLVNLDHYLDLCTGFQTWLWTREPLFPFLFLLFGLELSIPGLSWPATVFWKDVLILWFHGFTDREEFCSRRYNIHKS